MNSYHKLLEAVGKRDILFPDGIPDKGRSAIFRVLDTEGAHSAQCFDMGDLFGLEGFRVPGLDVRMPFKVTWFEGYINNETHGFLAIADDEFNLKVGYSFCSRGNGWECYGGLLPCGSGSYQSLTTERFRKTCEMQMGFMLVFVSALACVNVKRVKHDPPEKLQKARMKRGRLPLFSYWTLELKQERSESEPLGGTHSSPRLHLRRGHPRQFAPGKWTWVQPCVVGNKQLGMVHKDYKLSDNPFKPNPANFARA